MKYILIFTLLMPVLGHLKAQDYEKKDQKLANHFQSRITTDGDKPVVNILAYLRNIRDNYVFHQGYGWIDLEEKVPVSKDQTFKVASITKMFTAVIVLQLHEENLINLDSPVYAYLKDLTYLKFDSLHVYEGNSYGKEITIRQLLSHRSGLADLFVDAEERFNSYVLTHKQEQWSASKLFDKYYEYQVNQMAKFVPGSSYAYTDVGYFLLGLCIEYITGSSLATQYRERIIEPLGMEYTYFEYHDEPIKDVSQAHAYIGNLDATTAINTSYDWAGGGIVSNAHDLSIFIDNLFNHNLFSDQRTLALMTADKMYGYGISIFKIGKKKCYGHLGFWGSGVFHDPVNQTTIVLSINQVTPPFDAFKFVKKTMRIMEKY